MTDMNHEQADVEAGQAADDSLPVVRHLLTLGIVLQQH